MSGTRTHVGVRLVEDGMVRQFSLEQKVRLSGDGGISSKHLSPDGVYEITRLMPEDQAGTFHYRVRSAAGELVLRESQLVADMLPPAASPAKSHSTI